MPKERGLYLNLPRLLTRQTMDHILLGYVIGFRHISPLLILQVRAAVEKFIEDFQISEDDYPLDSMLRNFYKIYDDLSEYQKLNDEADRMRWIRLQKRKQNGIDQSNKEG